jgi:hypothetical protein
MGKLERKCLHSKNPYGIGWWFRRRPLFYADQMLTGATAGHLSVHAMRCPSPKVRHAHLQGQITEHGQMGQCASRRKDSVTTKSQTGVDKCLEHEADWEFRVEQDI